jgi:hypothetical protein
MRRDQLQAAFLIAAERADEREVRRFVEDGADVNSLIPQQASRLFTCPLAGMP